MYFVKIHAVTNWLNNHFLLIFLSLHRFGSRTDELSGESVRNAGDAVAWWRSTVYTELWCDTPYHYRRVYWNRLMMTAENAVHRGYLVRCLVAYFVHCLLMQCIGYIAVNSFCIRGGMFACFDVTHVFSIKVNVFFTHWLKFCMKSWNLKLFSQNSRGYLKTPLNSPILSLFVLIFIHFSCWF